MWIERKKGGGGTNAAHERFLIERLLYLSDGKWRVRLLCLIRMDYVLESSCKKRDLFKVGPAGNDKNQLTKELLWMIFLNATTRYVCAFCALHLPNVIKQIQSIFGHCISRFGVKPIDYLLSHKERLTKASRETKQNWKYKHRTLLLAKKCFSISNKVYT